MQRQLAPPRRIEAIGQLTRGIAPDFTKRLIVSISKLELKRCDCRRASAPIDA